MKRFLLLIGTLLAAACSSTTAPVASPKAPTGISKDVGDACTTSDGRMGYMINSGRELVCQPSQT